MTTKLPAFPPVDHSGNGYNLALRENAALRARLALALEVLERIESIAHEGWAAEAHAVWACDQIRRTAAETIKTCKVPA